MPDLLCHGTGRLFPHHEGADLFADKDAEKIYAGRLTETAQELEASGFTRVDNSNAWEKDGVRITLQQVMQEGMTEVLTKHAEVVRTLSATPGS